jgi:hypothetical protein
MGTEPEGAGKGPAWSPMSLPLLAIPSAPAIYLLEAGPALAEAQAGAGMDPDVHLPSLLGLGRVIESAPHRMAPVSGGQWREGRRIF